MLLRSLLNNCIIFSIIYEKKRKSERMEMEKPLKIIIITCEILQRILNSLNVFQHTPGI